MSKLIPIYITLFLALSSGIYACSCTGISTVKGSLKYSDAVVTGKVISKELITLVDSSAIKANRIKSANLHGYPYEITVVKYEMTVTIIYKGKITADTIEIYTGKGGGDCGIRFETGKEYIVYAESETYFGRINNNWPFPQGNNIYWTNSCSRTTIKNSQETDELEKYRK